MAILQSAIERKLSALLGVEVSFEQLNLSLLAGSIEAVGVKVGDFLTVARIVAKVAAARALKGEIVVRSLTIERPIVHIDRVPRQFSKRTAPADGEDKTRWTFDVEKMLVIEGQVIVSQRISIDKLLMDFQRKGEHYALTLLTDPIAGLGQLRGIGTIRNAADLSALMAAAAEITLELGDLARIRFATPKLRSTDGQFQVDGKITIAQLLALLAGYKANHSQ